MPKTSQFKYEIMAIKNLKPGQGIRFKIDKPWSLCTLWYKYHRKGYEEIVLRRKDGEIIAFHKPVIIEWQS